jgi:Uma2 family endonuclease
MRNINYIPKYSYEDYQIWEGKWELIEGIPYAMVPLPIFKHQRLSGKIFAQLDELLQNCPECTVNIAIDWKIDENTVLQPDNSVICYEPAEKYLTKAPSVIFEILSPGTAFKDKTIKYKIYEEQGVKYYIIVDLYAKVAEIYLLENGAYNKSCEAQDDIVNFDLGECKIDFNFSKIWP